MIDWFKNLFWYIIDRALTAILCMLEYDYKPQERYDEAWRRRGIYLIRICIKARDVDIEPWFLRVVPDCFKTREMCEKAVKKCLYLLKYVPDWFVTHQQIKKWHDNDDYCNYDKLTEWYEGYKKRKAQKAQIKKELLPIAWHLSRYWDWCVPEDEKREIEKLLR